jgi:hypothetical protein
MKTAMQELINWCNSCLTDKSMSDGGRIALEVTIVRATDLIEKEKEQIRLAFFRDGHEYWDEITSEEYYNQNYNENK